MLKLNSIMIGTTQLPVMGAFYEKVFGRPADMFDSEEGFFSWKFGGTSLAVFTHSEMTGNTKDPGRLMINYGTEDVRQEFERIRDLGGRVVSEPYQMDDGWVATLADPEGNYFQIVPLTMGV
jgi:predicted enzyme related to lactoylglutathione lyase